MKKHRRSGSISIDIDDFIAEVGDDDLLDEVHARNLVIESPGFDAMDEVRDAYNELRCGRPAAALSILDRIINPKWDSPQECQSAYAAAFKF